MRYKIGQIVLVAIIVYRLVFEKIKSLISEGERKNVFWWLQFHPLSISDVERSNQEKTVVGKTLCYTMKGELYY